MRVGSDTASPRENGSAWWSLFVAGVLCAVLVGFTALSQYGDSRGNTAAACWNAGAPAGAAPGEETMVDARPTAFPAGRLCVWRAAQGGTVSQQTGWLATGIGLVGTVAGVVATVALVRMGGARSRRLLSFIPLVLIMTLWAGIVAFAIGTGPSDLATPVTWVTFVR